MLNYPSIISQVPGALQTRTQPTAAQLSRALQGERDNDPRYRSAQRLKESALQPFGVGAGWAGVASQILQGYMGGKAEKKLGEEYGAKQAERNAMYAKILQGYNGGIGGGSADQTEPLDPMVAQILAGGDPNLQEAVAQSIIKTRLDPKERPKYKTERIGDKVVAYAENDPNNRVEMGAAPNDKTPTDWDMYERAMGQLPPEQQVDFLTYKKMLAQAGASRVNNTTNINPQKDEQFGEPPKDMVWARDEKGGMMMQEVPGMPGVRRPVAVPIAGGPPDLKGVEGEQKAAERAAGTQRQGNIVLENVKKAKDQASFWTTGFVGSKLASVPGTPAFDLGQTLQTIKANIGFDKLQEMRNNSPTGGALGAVSDVETKLLQSVVAAVEQSQSQEQFKENMDVLEREYDRIVNGPGGGQKPTATQATTPTRVIRYDADGNRVQ